jgi:hypothetical protein
VTSLQSLASVGQFGRLWKRGEREENKFEQRPVQELGVREERLRQAASEG